jgi:4-hydroxybenzoate polyprenyltransferase
MKKIINIISKLKIYFHLLRVNHYIKNVLIFIPLFFSSNAMNMNLFIVSIIGFVWFSLASSFIYIVNDILDKGKDRLHPVKCYRPIASGAVTLKTAIVITIFLLIVIFTIAVFWYIFRTGLSPSVRLFPVMLIVIYAFLNIAYSFGLKNIPIIDITILASGFVLRIIFGSALINVDISIWLYLLIIAGAYYMGLGKRRNEINQNGIKTRAVMHFYTHDFLDKNMYMYQTLCIFFYTLWCIDESTIQRFGGMIFIYTIPLIFIIFFKYSLNIESDSEGDPTSIILHDKVLLLLCFTYAVWAFVIIYWKK